MSLEEAVDLAVAMAPVEQPGGLTEREAEVLTLVVRGLGAGTGR